MSIAGAESKEALKTKRLKSANFTLVYLKPVHWQCGVEQLH